MKLKWIVLAAIVVLFTASCDGMQNAKHVSEISKIPEKKQPQKTAQQTIKIQDKSILKSSPTMKIIYPQISGMKDKAAQAEINAVLKKTASNVDEGYMTNDDPSMPPSFSSKYKITFQNNHLISFIYDQYIYSSGAAHGMPLKIPVLVDLQQGKIVEPNELFNGSGRAKQMISQIILKSDVFNTLQSMGEFKEISEEDLDNVYLTKEGLIIFFPPYEYASYAEGTLQYQLPYSDIKSIVNTNFLQRHGIKIEQSDHSITIFASEGYHFSIPKKWINHLVFERAEITQDKPWFAETKIYYKSSEKILLFTIHMYEKQKWVPVNERKEVKLAEDHEIIYSYLASQDSQKDSQEITNFKKNVLPEMMKSFELDF